MGNLQKEIIDDIGAPKRPANKTAKLRNEAFSGPHSRPQALRTKLWIKWLEVRFGLLISKVTTFLIMAFHINSFHYRIFHE